jgi:hypothetical protein
MSVPSHARASSCRDVRTNNATSIDVRATGARIARNSEAGDFLAG